MYPIDRQTVRSCNILTDQCSIHLTVFAFRVLQRSVLLHPTHHDFLFGYVGPDQSLVLVPVVHGDRGFQAVDQRLILVSQHVVLSDGGTVGEQQKWIGADGTALCSLGGKVVLSQTVSTMAVTAERAGQVLAHLIASSDGAAFVDV